MATTALQKIFAGITDTQITALGGHQGVPLVQDAVTGDVIDNTGGVNALANAVLTSGQKSKGASQVAGYNPTTGEIIMGAHAAPLPAVGSGQSVSPGVIGGATPWTRLYGPNELRQAPWSESPEMTGASRYVTMASPANGPCMTRIEGASMLFLGSVILSNAGNPNFANYRNQTAGLSASQFVNTTIGLLVYIHKLTGNSKVILRIGTSSANYVTHTWAQTSNMLVEGWNFLVCHTGSPIGNNADLYGQEWFQSAGTAWSAWKVGAGTFAFDGTGTYNYVAFELQGLNAQAHTWLEGIYLGGKDTSYFTMGFDIQTSGLDLANSTMQTYGLTKGYAAVPCSNAVTANPQFLWLAADVARLQALYQAGWEVIQHSLSHNSMGNFSDVSALLCELDGCRSQIERIGCDAAKDYFATPNGSYSNRLVALCARVGIKWIRNVNASPMMIGFGLVGAINPLMQGCCSMAYPRTAAQILAFIDLCLMFGVSFHLYTHAILPDADPNATNGLNMKLSDFTAVCAGIQSRMAANPTKLIPCLPSEFVRNTAPPSMSAVFAAPSKLAITAGTSPYVMVNTSFVPLRYAIYGGTVTNVEYSRDGIGYDSVGTASYSGIVDPGDMLRITYTVAPTIQQYST